MAGIVASIQTHGSLANWHPQLHLLVTDDWLGHARLAAFGVSHA